MIQVLVKSPKLLELLQNCLTTAWDGKATFKPLPQTHQFEPEKSYILVDLVTCTSKPELWYQNLKEQANENGAKLFVISMHGDSNFLCKSAVSQLHRELCQQVRGKDFQKTEFASEFHGLLPRYY